MKILMLLYKLFIWPQHALYLKKKTSYINVESTIDAKFMTSHARYASLFFFLDQSHLTDI